MVSLSHWIDMKTWGLNFYGFIVSDQSLSTDEPCMILEPVWALSIIWDKTMPYNLSVTRNQSFLTHIKLLTFKVLNLCSSFILWSNLT